MRVEDWALRVRRDLGMTREGQCFLGVPPIRAQCEAALLALSLLSGAYVAPITSALPLPEYMMQAQES